MGFNFIIYPVAAMAASATALNAAYQHLLEGEPDGARVSFQELSAWSASRKIISKRLRLWRKAAMVRVILGAIHD